MCISSFIIHGTIFIRDKFGLLIVIVLVTYHLPPVFLLPRRARQTVTIFIDQCNRMHQSQNSSHFDTDGMENKNKKKGKLMHL
mmetsp:Transcript_32152/g.42827  ORF Transcript_32152/g.42827 Transcript_32152/m.42827 type:complete len:83 (+) Transcript_32152:994-1242(+)